ncbi:3-keto-5-aminohexanoate cleavage protein [Tropicimonas sediminicola]|uniref:Uncharacterized conserved protein, DUF849 family n=1 Tax=Tropicimonas sediminicola TaxID=1031541 RepID=A0A239HZ73_9RHOB|nr:3-keto-5-aminohexanoate cleavage protein [Tropicimonas sediminicola]SNS86650.1 Uncharacterized conserved protein, DUF849 family [Tropicimonas sediminicola]
MTPLPRLMVAPNGARRGKADHPALPITDDEIVETARACQDAGADGIHVHIRDERGRHLLDAGRYHALLDRLGDAVPGMYLQVTSEAAGRYEAAEQRAMMRKLKPAHVSVGLREMVRRPEDWPEARDFYHWAKDSGVEIQHILYSPHEVGAFAVACASGLIPGTSQAVIFVQGSYANGSRDSIALEEYLQPLSRAGDVAFDWMVCAFGAEETASLVRAAELGGKARVGFENSLWNANGEVAEDNAARVREVFAALQGVGRPVVSQPTN